MRNPGVNHSICSGSSIAIGGSAVSGNQYLWTSNPTGFTSTDNNPTVNPTITTTYTITETNPTTGCSNSNSTVVTVNSLPVPNAGSNNAICMNSSTAIGSSSVTGHQYSWTSSPSGFTSTQSSPTVSPTSSTTYTLSETIAATGCSNAASVSITVNALPTPNAGSNRTICNGISWNIGSNATSGDNYSWLSNPVGFSSTVSNPTVSPTISTTYTLTETIAATGCTNSDNVVITVSTTPTASFTYTTGCLGDSTNFKNTSVSAVSYSWYFGDGSLTSSATDPQHLFGKLGNYTVTLLAQNSSGCEDSVSKLVSISTCVWPGDANFDKKADMYDILAVGVAYSDTGSPRPDTSTTWTGHYCKDWANSFSSGANHKHADGNGDGTVDSLDLAAISLNYGKTHTKTESTSGGNPSDPALSLSISKDSVNVKDTLLVKINLGTSSNPVSNIYGLCFSVTYDPTNVNQSKGIIANLSNSWMGTPGKDLIYLIHNDVSSGILDIGISRTDHKNVSGYGSIGELSIIMPDNVGGKKEVRKELLFNVGNVKAIEFNETGVPLYYTSDSTLFYQFTSGISPIANALNNIHLYPNPANSVLHLDAGKLMINEITISNLLGENVMIQKTTNLNKSDLDISALVPGMYIIDIRTNDGLMRTRFVKD